MEGNPTGADHPLRGHVEDPCESYLGVLPLVRSMLVIRLSAMGDVVRTLPAVSALRAAYPQAHLAWLVEPLSASALEEQPWIDEVLVFPRQELASLLARGQVFAFSKRLRVLARELRERRFDCVVDFHSILKSGLLSRASGAPRRIAYAPPFGREGSWLFATDLARLSLPQPGAKLSRFARNLALVRFLGVEAEPDPKPWRLTRDAETRMAELLGEERPVVIHPGTSDRTPYKRYTVEGYAAVARALRASHGLACVVTVGPALGDRAFAEAIVARAQGNARIAPATPTLSDLAALFAHARLYIGSDTGPMHVASLVGTPVVQLLGPTDPVENAPYPGTPSRTVRVPQPCSPCRRGCELATCMTQIQPEQVIRAARELLESSR